MKENTQIPFVLIEKSQKRDYMAVKSLMATAPEESLINVSRVEFGDWVDHEITYVAKTMLGEVLGHQAGIELPESKWVEVRTAVTNPEFQGIGINTKLKKVVIEEIQSKGKDTTVVAFTERGSMSRFILAKGGFSEIPFEAIPSEMFEACPNTCVKKTGVECGCKVYTLKPGKEFKLGK